VNARLQPPDVPEGSSRRREILAALARHKEQMRQIGYRCRKVGSRWHAWLLIPEGERQPGLFGKAA
jgi:hypothetical protein